jgi:hypothetical protein
MRRSAMRGASGEHGTIADCGEELRPQRIALRLWPSHGSDNAESGKDQAGEDAGCEPESCAYHLPLTAFTKLSQAVRRRCSSATFCG